MFNFVRLKVKLKCGVELGIVSLVSVVDILIVNNIIFIIMVGLLVKNIVDEYDVDLRKLVSILDIFGGCF